MGLNSLVNITQRTNNNSSSLEFAGGPEKTSFKRKDVYLRSCSKHFKTGGIGICHDIYSMKETLLNTIASHDRPNWFMRGLESFTRAMDPIDRFIKGL